MSNTIKSLPPYQSYNKLIVPRKQTYKDWFKTPIYHVAYDSDNPKDTLTHGEYIKYRIFNSAREYWSEGQRIKISDYLHFIKIIRKCTSIFYITFF